MTDPLQFGDCLFETVRVEGHDAPNPGPQRLERHLARFERSAQMLGYTNAEIVLGQEHLHQLSQAEAGLWRLTFVRAADVLGDWDAHVRTEQRDFPPSHRPNLGLAPTYFPQYDLAEHKTTSYLASMQTRRLARAQGFDDALRVSPCGRVGEASMANVFFVQGRTIFTPSLEGVLPGTTRQAILEAASQRGIDIEETPVQTQDLRDVDEVVLTSSGILAVSAQSLEGRPLQQHWGPVFREWLCS